jgi:tetratricopeptide (TPR) repeat protein
LFVAIIFLILILIAIAGLRDWISYPYLFKRISQKKLQAITQLIALEQFEEAKLQLQPLLKRKKPCKKSSLCHIRVLRGTRQLDEALKITQTAARLYPEELLFRLEEAIIFLLLDRTKEALEAFNVCSPILQEEKELYLLALTYYKLGHYEQCSRILTPLLENSQDDQLCILAADTKVHQRQFGKAITLYTMALEIRGQDHVLTIKLADAYRRHGNLTHSEKMYRQILETDSSDVEATLGFAACMSERGLLQKAYLFLRSSNAWRKEDSRLYFQAALLGIKLKRYDEGQELLGYLLEKGKSSLETLIYSGYCLEKQQKWSQAEAIYLRLVDQYPQHPHGYRALSWMFGVGISTQLSLKEGLFMANCALKLLPDAISWEVLSACEARACNFVRAYEILDCLAQEETDPSSKQRLQRAMRLLKKNLPLNDNLVLREKVA